MSKYSDCRQEKHTRKSERGNKEICRVCGRSSHQTSSRFTCWISRLLFVTHQAFKLFDLDGDGVVSTAELRKVLTRAGAHRVTDTEARKMVEMADSDGNEVLDYSEFEQLWNQIRADTEVSG